LSQTAVLSQLDKHEDLLDNMTAAGNMVTVEADITETIHESNERWEDIKKQLSARTHELTACVEVWSNYEEDVEALEAFITDVASKTVTEPDTHAVDVNYLSKQLALYKVKSQKIIINSEICFGETSVDQCVDTSLLILRILDLVLSWQLIF